MLEVEQYQNTHVHHPTFPQFSAWKLNIDGSGTSVQIHKRTWHAWTSIQHGNSHSVRRWARNRNNVDPSGPNDGEAGRTRILRGNPAARSVLGGFDRPARVRKTGRDSVDEDGECWWEARKRRKQAKKRPVPWSKTFVCSVMYWQRMILASVWEKKDVRSRTVSEYTCASPYKWEERGAGKTNLTIRDRSKLCAPLVTSLCWQTGMWLASSRKTENKTHCYKQFILHHLQLSWAHINQAFPKKLTLNNITRQY